MSNCDKCHHRYQFEKIDNIKSQRIKTKSIHSECSVSDNIKGLTGSIGYLSSNNILSSHITTTDLNVSNITVDTINGLPVNCSRQAFDNMNTRIQIVDYGPTGPIKPTNPNFNQTVWDALWENTLLQINGPEECPSLGLQGRLHCGRMTKRYNLQQYGCEICPDEFPGCDPVPASEGPTGCSTCYDGFIQVCSVCSDETECPKIPQRILGVQTFQPSTFQECGGNIVTQLLSSVSYNLNVLNVAETLGTRVVTVMIQGAYLDGDNGEIVQIDFSNRQFETTLDTLYGEKYAANITLPTSIMEVINNNFGAIQVVIYIEQGIEIQVLPPPSLRIKSRSNKISLKQVENPGAISAQYLSYDGVPYPSIEETRFTPERAASGANYGYSVDISGDSKYIAVGAPTSSFSGVLSTEGAVYIYTMSEDRWIEELLTERNINSLQGLSVSLSNDGNTLVTGLPGTISEPSSVGSVVVYTRTGDVWTKEATLSTPGNINQGFSVSLSGDGNTLAVGAPYTNGSNGSALVYTRTGTTWSSATVLVGSGNTGASQQGWSVSLSGDGNTLAVGGPRDRPNEAISSLGYGATWVFVKNDEDWVQQDKIVLPTDLASNPVINQGRSVSLSGDGNILAIGAPYANIIDGNLKNVQTGSTIIYTRSDSIWNFNSVLIGGRAENIEGTQGWSVSLSNDGTVLAAGSPFILNDNLQTTPVVGKTWIFTRSGTVWSTKTNLVGTSLGLAEQGYSVSLSNDGTNLLIGGPQDNSNQLGNEGAAWLFSN